MDTALCFVGVIVLIAVVFALAAIKIILNTSVWLYSAWDVAWVKKVPVSYS